MQSGAFGQPGGCSSSVGSCIFRKKRWSTFSWGSDVSDGGSTRVRDERSWYAGQKITGDCTVRFDKG